MKIRCLSNQGRDLPIDCRDPAVNLDEKSVFPLLVGKEYTVYGMTVSMGYVWYYISDEHDLYYPVWHPSPLFEVTDGRLSRLWCYGNLPGKSAQTTYPILAFKEWVEDPLFYDHLTDGQPEAVQTFARYKELLDAESK
jgi:hypothetical protein